MKILLRYCYFWGNYTTHSIEITPETKIQALKCKIGEKFGVNLNDIIIKIFRDGFSVFYYYHYFF